MRRRRWRGGATSTSRGTPETASRLSDAREAWGSFSPGALGRNQPSRRLPSGFRPPELRRHLCLFRPLGLGRVRTSPLGKDAVRDSNVASRRVQPAFTSRGCENPELRV